MPEQFNGERNRRGALATTIACAVVMAVIAVLAVISPGYSTQKLDLDDGSVWVMNSEMRMVGHANTQLKTLSTAMTAVGNDLSLIQEPDALIVHDSSNNTLNLADVAEAKLTAPIPLPAGSPKVVPAGNLLLTYLPSSGDMWVTPKDSLNNYSYKNAPTRNLGSNSVLAADDQKNYVGYSMRSGKLISGSLAAGAPKPKTTKVTFTKPSKHIQATMAGSKPVLLNPAANQLWIDGRFTSLHGVVADGATLRLADPTPDATRVLLADDAGLVAVPLDGGTPARIEKAKGKPAAPARLGDCDYAAWSSGIALRMCGGADPVTLDLDGVDSSAVLSFQANGPNIVANDPATGQSWAVRSDGALIDNWTDFVQKRTQKTTKEEPRDVPPKVDKVHQKPPVAVADVFGVRAGRANELPILLNDYDPNGDPLIITKWSADAIPPGFGAMALIDNGQKLQLTTTSGAGGTLKMSYWISDGHTQPVKGTATISVKGVEENSPPAQKRITRTSVVAGGTTTVHNALADWVDPESDPLYLENATTNGPGKVRFTPDGKIDFTDGGGPALQSIRLTVSDGTKRATGLINVSVTPKGNSPILAESFTMTGYAGQPLTVKPLEMARGGNAPITLSEVRPVPMDRQLTIIKDFESGAFTVTARSTAAHFLRYTVTDGTHTASAIIRLEITQPPAKARPPVTAADTAFLNLQKSRTVDVLANDYDPAGGVLSISGVGATPKGSGIVAEIVERKVLRVTLMKPLEGPITIRYTASAGSLTSTGTLTVVMVDPPAKLQPPVANPDTATVRVNSVIDIPVLTNDTQANKEPLFLDHMLVRGEKAGNGIAFVSGDKIRYLAPNKPGEYTLVYRVSTSDGQWATAPVRISVRAVDRADDHPPVPIPVTARVTANEKVAIPIPLSGIDPDGDTVTLVGKAQGSEPRLGAVTAVKDNALVYSAGSTPGTDQFQYTVVDALGAEASGTIRVGVDPENDSGTPPVAMDDVITVPPGTRLSVPVLNNDSNPDGTPLKVVAVRRSGSGPVATHTATRVEVTAPENPGTYAVMYTAANERGGTSRAWLTLQVRRDAPPIAPTASDVVLRLADIDGFATVDVDTSKAVEFTASMQAPLRFSLPVAIRGGSIDRDGIAHIPVLPHSRIVPFTVWRGDDPAARASAFIWIPGTDDAAPDLRPNAPALTVVSGEKLVIHLATYVMAIDGRTVTVPDPATVSATHADADESGLVKDDRTLVFRSAPDYWGPASITFTASDGRTKAPLVLAITVVPARDQPPTVQPNKVELETGGSTRVQLDALTNVANAADRVGLTYTVVSKRPELVTAFVSGSVLTIRAAQQAAPGSAASLIVTARTAKGLEGRGTTTVGIVASSKPLVSAVADKAVVRRGESVEIPALANDEATNPFPGKPLHIASASPPKLPGVTVAVSADRRTLTVRTAASAATGSVTFPYRVADASGEPSREVTGVVSVQIQDVPDAPPGPPRITAKDVDGQKVTLAIPHAFPNASAITTYTVTDDSGKAVTTCTDPDSCSITGIQYGVPYRFGAYATNGVGDGKPGPLSDVVILDVVPSAPAGVMLRPSGTDRSGHTLEASWSALAGGKGTAIESYQVTLTGPGVRLSKTVPASTTTLTFANPGIAPGEKYTLAVRGKNKTNAGAWGRASAGAVAAPSFGAVTHSRDPKSTGVIVDWTIANTGGRAVTSYVAHIPKGTFAGATTCEPSRPAGSRVPGTTWTDPDGKDSYDWVVTTTNGLFCTSAVATGALAPTMGTVTAELTDTGTGMGIVITRAEISAGTATSYQYRLTTAAGSTNWITFDPAVARTTVLSGTRNGTKYAVWVRALNGSAASTPVRASHSGRLVPISYLPTSAACTAGGIPAVSVTPPDNGPVKTMIEVRFLVVGEAGQAQQDYTDWEALTADTQVPAGSRHLEIRTNVDPYSTPFLYPNNPVPCG